MADCDDGASGVSFTTSSASVTLTFTGEFTKGVLDLQNENIYDIIEHNIREYRRIDNAFLHIYIWFVPKQSTVGVPN